MTKQYTEEQIKEAENIAIWHCIVFGEEITTEEILEELEAEESGVRKVPPQQFSDNDAT